MKSNSYFAIREWPQSSKGEFGKGDVLVLFGELFQRGYANGLVAAAQAQGMQIVSGTVGRRQEDDTLRALTTEEIREKPVTVINVPLEAGFDLEKDSEGLTPVDRLKSVKLSSWQEFSIDPRRWQEARAKGKARFEQAVKKFLEELRHHISPKQNILFAHLMAGGVPRAKIIMPLMNRMLKGKGDRFLASETVWSSSFGQLMSESFDEVTACTFDTLIRMTTDIRSEWQKQGRQVSYLGYGYHGTEVLVDGSYTWQTYTPYVQGWAKRRLEDFARKWTNEGVSATIYNCPEILTNSSAIFSGVELSLYPLIGALQKESVHSPKTQAMLEACQNLLSPEVGFEKIQKFTREYLTSALVGEYSSFEKWPQHNGKEQLENMVNASDTLISWHKNEKELITVKLSEVIVEGCGRIMLADSFAPQSPVSWINHDILAKIYG